MVELLKRVDPLAAERAPYHDVVVREVEEGRSFQVNCTCGGVWVAFFGMAQVEAIVERHYEEHGVRSKIVLL